jgi:hypothetical protein
VTKIGRTRWTHQHERRSLEVGNAIDAEHDDSPSRFFSAASTIQR